jgi:hypothetical protein
MNVQLPQIEQKMRLWSHFDMPPRSPHPNHCARSRSMWQRDRVGWPSDELEHDLLHECAQNRHNVVQVAPCNSQTHAWPVLDLLRAKMVHRPQSDRLQRRRNEHVWRLRVVERLDDDSLPQRRNRRVP